MEIFLLAALSWCSSHQSKPQEQENPETRDLALSVGSARNRILTSSLLYFNAYLEILQYGNQG